MFDILARTLFTAARVNQPGHRKGAGAELNDSRRWVPPDLQPRHGHHSHDRRKRRHSRG